MLGHEQMYFETALNKFRDLKKYILENNPAGVKW